MAQNLLNVIQPLVDMYRAKMTEADEVRKVNYPDNRYK